MSQIHHPHVPGFQAHLQHSMTRFFAELGPEPEVRPSLKLGHVRPIFRPKFWSSSWGIWNQDCRWRSNFGFNTHGHIVDHGMPHSELIHGHETRSGGSWDEELVADNDKPSNPGRV